MEMNIFDLVIANRTERLLSHAVVLCAESELDRGRVGVGDLRGGRDGGEVAGVEGSYEGGESGGELSGDGLVEVRAVGGASVCFRRQLRT